ncbi:MAG TPA: nitroreductase family protein [Nocardioidaceae bacterium]
MEFQDVVRRRRMVRSYSDRPVDTSVVERILTNALHAPSAGFTQGWAFLLLDSPADVDRFWTACTPPPAAEEPDSWLRGMRTAPVVIVPFSNKAAYVGRYSEADKARDRVEARWPVPYWHMDTAMASLLMLLTAVDEGLGACFFGIPDSRTAAFRAEFGVPDDHMPIGAITLGHRTSDPGPRGSAARRQRRPLEEVLHRGSW